jgi:hypothetical protein
MSGDPADTEPSEAARRRTYLGRNVMQLGVRKHRLAKIYERSGNARPDTMEQPEPDLERTNMRCNRLCQPDSLFRRVDVEGNDYW